MPPAPSERRRPRRDRRCSPRPTSASSPPRRPRRSAGLSMKSLAPIARARAATRLHRRKVSSPGARLGQERGSRSDASRSSARLADPLDPRLALRRHGVVFHSSRSSHSFANRQSRFTVSVETSEHLGSLLVRQPAEEPQLHHLALPRMRSPQAPAAPRRAPRDRVRARARPPGLVEGHLAVRRARFSLRRARAKSTRMRRITRADIAKKCARFCQRTRSTSIRRR